MARLGKQRLARIGRASPLALALIVISALIGAQEATAQAPADTHDLVARSQRLYDEGRASGDVAKIVEAANLRSSLAASPAEVDKQKQAGDLPVRLLSADEMLKEARSIAGSDESRLASLQSFREQVIVLEPGGEAQPLRWWLEAGKQIYFTFRATRAMKLSVQISSDHREGRFNVELRAEDGRRLCANETPMDEVTCACALPAGALVRLTVVNVGAFRAYVTGWVR